MNFDYTTDNNLNGHHITFLKNMVSKIKKYECHTNDWGLLLPIRYCCIAV